MPDLAQEAAAAEKIADRLESIGEHALAATHYGRASDKWEREAKEAASDADNAAGLAQCRLRCKAGHDYMLAGDDRDKEAAALGAANDSLNQADARDKALRDFEKAADLLKSCAACMKTHDPARSASAYAEAARCFTHIKNRREKEQAAHKARMKKLEDEGKKDTDQYKTAERAAEQAKKKAEDAQRESEEARKGEEQVLKIAAPADGLEMASMDDLAPFEASLASLRQEIGRLSFFAPAAVPILADIIKGPHAWTGRSDKVTKKRTDNCSVTVTDDVKYEMESSRTETGADGKPVRTCTTYKVTTKVTVSETCSPGGTTVIGTTQHVSHREFCGSANDDPTTGESVGFDAKETDTLAYPHGTKVTVEKEGEKIKVAVAYPDGTTTSLTVPK